ncbi:MAG: DUF4870 domain-containing protein [Blastocatellia bacterium]|nr:DUF4870 domain-containing protein [Blastocatellia bacterium]
MHAVAAKASSRSRAAKLIESKLIIWLVKRGDSPEIDPHGKEALNFQISMLIYNLVSAVFCLILIGFVFLAILWVLNAILVIIASIQVSEGKFYSYPMTIRFIQ